MPVNKLLYIFVTHHYTSTQNYPTVDWKPGKTLKARNQDNTDLGDSYTCTTFGDSHHGWGKIFWGLLPQNFENS